MCELFALSASSSVDVRLSLHELARHGGETGMHADGWGVAFLQDRDVAVFREPSAAARSPWIACLETHPVRTMTALAHIRHATRGAVTLENTQPFSRELWGRVHVFAHNGELGAGLGHAPAAARYRAIGETDSEAAFCLLLDHFAAGVDPARAEAAGVIFETFATFAREMRRKGPANIIYASNGQVLVHADRRTKALGVIEPPGLWLLERHCSDEAIPAVAGEAVHVTGTGVDAALIASVPLTDEGWRPLEQGSVLQLEHGCVRRTERV